MEEDIVKKVLGANKFKELNPVQQLAVKKGLFKRKNMVVAAPTASGKTLVAELAAINIFFSKTGKTIYIVPLVALASEKYEEFKKKYQQFGMKIAMSVGDFDSSDPWLAEYDVIICTTEKCDSLIRHGAGWMKDVGSVIVDEVHMLNDVSRGPTLEVTITKLRDIAKHAQILALSATIKNAKEIASWLDATLVKSDWRPVKLYVGTCCNSEIKFLDRDGYELNSGIPQEASIVENTLKIGKQVLFFVATRRNAESLAEKLGRVTKSSLGKSDTSTLDNLASDVENTLETPTKQCKRLSGCIKTGTAFHHAGLLHKQKALIENNFRSGLLRAIVATPTLAYGVNLPAFRVIMRDLRRYYPGVGSVFIPVMEVHQMLGRCGRPQFDSFGEGIILARNDEEAEEMTQRYILGEPEKIYSKLAVEPILRMHTLALIASGATKTEESLFDFFSKTFYAYQYRDMSEIELHLKNILGMLEEWKFITCKTILEATRIGKRVSDLYIDPSTAYFFISCLNKVSERTEPLSYLQMISNTPEMRPLLTLRSGEFTTTNDAIVESTFLQPVPDEWDLDFEDFIKSVKTAMMFESWINEATEDKIMSDFGVMPGELRGRLQNADWLVYAAQELALLLGLKDILKDIRKLRVRITYGVREDLMPLIRLRQIGRMRARKLWNVGLKTIDDLRKAPFASLSTIVGAGVARIIKDQLEGKTKLEKQTKLF